MFFNTAQTVFFVNNAAKFSCEWVKEKRKTEREINRNIFSSQNGFGIYGPKKITLVFLRM